MDDYENHPTWLALCAAVIAAPADDLVRMVAADWLDENGQPERAAVIREHCSAKVEGRAFERGHAAEFFDPNSGTFSILAPAVTGVSYSTSRGFLAGVTCPWGEWHRHGPRLARLHPIASVILTDKQPYPYSHEWLFVEHPTASAHHLPNILLPFVSPTAYPVGGPLPRAPISVRSTSRKKAHAALIAAAIAWARHQTAVAPAPATTQ